MANIGFYSLVALIGVSLYALVMSILGVTGKRKDMIASAERAAMVCGGLVLLASAALFYSFLTRDFSVEYVNNYSDRSLSFIYTISGFWAGNAGSLLMWAAFLGVFMAVIVRQNRHKNRDLMPWVTAVLSGQLAFFGFILVFMANPFKLIPGPMPLDGQGLNPMLHNPGMYLHPPTTYLGYVGFAVPFAFAMASLITGRLSDIWIRTTRRWTIFAWFFLTLGNIVGAWWAYYTLGWGGYWAWDPVENSSFMPWLVGTAYLHSVMIQEKKGMLKIWNIALIIITFAFTILGTIITRSGIINSVHTFSNSGLGPFLFAFFLVTVGGGFALLIYRLPHLKSENELDSLVSRESMFLFNNLILLGIAFTTLWGTVYPFISEAITGEKVTVGQPFYDQVSAPLGIALLFLVGFCPLIAWRRASLENLRRNFVVPLIVSGVGLAILLSQGLRHGAVLLTATLIIFVLTVIFMEFYRGTRARHRMTDESVLNAFVNLIWKNKRRYGGYTIHIGLAMIFVAFIGGPFKQQVEKTLKPGESMVVGNYKVVFDGMRDLPQAKMMTVEATMRVFDKNSNKQVGIVKPRKEFFEATGSQPQQPWTRVAVRSTFKDDLYFIFSPDEQGKEMAGFTVVINPLMRWMWVAGFVMTFGTVIALWPDESEKRRLASIYSRETVTNEA